MTQFTGFTPQTIDFLWELRMNNHKAFMEENRQRYQSVLKEPFDCLTKELIQRIEEIGKGMPRQASISRINRDIRFSKDKSPYRPKRWMVLHDGKQAGTDWKCQPVFYFELTPEAYYTGMGLYDSTPAFLQAYRRKIDADTAAFLRIANGLKRAKELTADGESYKRQMGNGAHAPLVELWYQKKEITISEERPIDELLFSDKLCDHVLAEWKKMVPLFRFLKEVSVG